MANDKLVSLVIVIVVIQFSMLLPSIKATSKSSYGEVCSKEKRCNSRALLSCSSEAGTCQCLMSNTMVYDEAEQKCVTLAGERCRYTTIEGDRSWSEDVACVQKAECKAGICTCTSKYFELANGTCETKRAFGEACSDNTMCESNLICGAVVGICECGAHKVYWESRRTCANIAGAPCSLGSDETCVEHSECRNEGPDMHACRCSSNHFQSVNGTCEPKRGLGGQCESNEQCAEFWFGYRNLPSSSFVVCNQGKCVCDSAISIENNLRNRDDFPPCLKLAGVTCRDDESSYGKSICANGSECNYYTHGRVCKCRPEFFQSKRMTCEERRYHGQACESDDSCKNELFLTCGSNGFCACQPGRAFDKHKQQCVLKVGAGSCRSSGQDPTYACPTNAYCYSSKCKCHDGYFTTVEGTCEKKKGYGEICSDSSNCKGSDTGQSLIACHNQKCVCNPSLALYNNGSNNYHESFPCSRLAGISCRGKSKHECVVGAVCRDTKCICEDEYFQAENKTCIPRNNYGEPCKSNQCRRDRYLECGSSGVCECNEATRLHPVRRECVGKAGSECTNGCVPNSECFEEYDVKYEASVRRCHCNPSATNIDGYCYIQNGQPCDSDTFRIAGNKTRTCSPGLVCENDICACEYPNHQVYVPDTRKCFSLVNGPCNASMICVENAECVTEGEIQVCRCKQGYNAVERVCDLAFGETCIQGQTPKCDRGVPLQCSTSGKCECSKFQAYNNETMKCHGLVGAKCRLNDPSFCGDHAVCEAFRGSWNSRNSDGICMCKDGYVSLSDRTCHLPTT